MIINNRWFKSSNEQDQQSTNDNQQQVTPPNPQTANIEKVQTNTTTS